MIDLHRGVCRWVQMSAQSLIHTDVYTCTTSGNTTTISTHRGMEKGSNNLILSFSIVPILHIFQGLPEKFGSLFFLFLNYFYRKIFNKTSLVIIGC